MTTEIKVIHAKDFIMARPNGELDLVESKSLLVQIASATKSLHDFVVVFDTVRPSRNWRPSISGTWRPSCRNRVTFFCGKPPSFVQANALTKQLFLRSARKAKAFQCAPSLALRRQCNGSLRATIHRRLAGLNVVDSLRVNAPVKRRLAGGNSERRIWAKPGNQRRIS